jgi:hypothetical protein
MPPITSIRNTPTTFDDVPEHGLTNFEDTPDIDATDDLQSVEEDLVVNTFSEETTTLKEDVEREPGQSYTFLSLLEKNSTVYNLMKSRVEASGFTIEQRSASIEHVW